MAAGAGDARDARDPWDPADAVPEGGAVPTADRWALVLPHAERLRRIAARRLGSADEADDVVQEALLRAVTFGNLDESYVGPFLTTVTIRLCADAQRDRTRQLRAGVRDALRTVAPGDPHDTLLDRAEARWLYDQCLKLPDRESAVVLARAQGLSVREAATSLGVGVKSAEAALTKARHRMRRMAQTAGVSALGVLRRFKHAAAPVAVAGAVTIAYVGGSALLDPRHGNRPAAAGDVPATTFLTGSPTEPASHEAPVTRTTAATAPAPPTHRADPPRIPPVPPPTAQVDAGTLGDPKVAGTRGGVTVEQRHPEQSFEEGLMDCISHGIVNIAPPHYGVCDHGDE